MDKIVTSYHLDELASKLDGELFGENRKVFGVASIDRVRDGEITWVESSKTLKEALHSPATALLLARQLVDDIQTSEEQSQKSMIVVSNPRYAFARALGLFYQRRLPQSGVASTAAIGSNVKLGKNVFIGDYTVIGDNSVIQDNAIIFPHVYLGFDVTVGEAAIIYPFASIYDLTAIGPGTIIHSGTVIGADGFGFVEIGGRQEKVPQVGCVELGANVEIGANVTIDRATTGVTYIGDGTKIDNLVQIGHNCQLGKNCIMVSQSGIAGSCVFGDNVTLAAQGGLAPHVHVGSNVIIAGRSGVNHDIPGNTVVSGFPAKPHKEALRIQAAVGRLPATMKTIKKMEKQIEALENLLKEKCQSDG